MNKLLETGVRILGCILLGVACFLGGWLCRALKARGNKVVVTKKKEEITV